MNGDETAMDRYADWLLVGRIGEILPARSTIQAGALPKAVRIEIDCVARIPTPAAD